MECPSILFIDMIAPTGPHHAALPQPSCFPDLHLDQIEAAVLDGEAAFGLEPVFRQPLGSDEAIRYRQDVFRDLAHPEIRLGLERFAVSMSEVRRSLSHAALLAQPEQRGMWRLDAACGYCGAVRALDALLCGGSPCEGGVVTGDGDARDDARGDAGFGDGRRERGLRSDALASFSRWLYAHAGDRSFRSFADATDALAAKLRGIRYALCHSETRVQVWRDGATEEAAHAGGGDLVESIRRTFSQIAPMPPCASIALFTQLEMGALELQILSHLRRMHPDAFTALAAWDKTSMAFPHPGPVQFDRELQFYLAWLRMTDTLAQADCPCTLPVVTEDATLRLQGMYDLALALKNRRQVVPNDCLPAAGERILVLTGPNQGGKSTYARALGQIAWLAALGVPVPAREAVMGRCDAILTHFATAEDPDGGSGRLQDELLRVRAMLEAASDRSLVLFNELFATTATQDAIDLGHRVLEQVRATGSRCLYVTHLAELADPETGVVSLVAEIQPGTAATRTFRIRRRPADGMAYAESLATRFGLDGDQVRRRMATSGTKGGMT